LFTAELAESAEKSK